MKRNVTVEGGNVFVFVLLLPFLIHIRKGILMIKYTLHCLQYETPPFPFPYHWKVKNSRLRQWVWNRESQQGFYKEVRNAKPYSDSNSSSSVTSGVISNFYLLSTEPFAKQSSHRAQRRSSTINCSLAEWDGCIPRMIFVVAGSEHRRSGSFPYRFQ